MLKEFISYVSTIGLARTNRFQVVIPVPRKAISTDNPILGIAGAVAGSINLSLMCHSAALPGKRLATTEIKYNADTLRMPYTQVYEPMPMSFKVSQTMTEKRILDAWVNNIYDPRAHEMSYYDDYTTDIVVTQLTNNDLPVATYILKDAYPMEVNSIELNHDDKNTYNRLNVLFSYKRFEQLF